MPRPDPLRTALQIIVYVVLSFLGVSILGHILPLLAGYLVGATLTVLIAAALSNYVSLRIYENLQLLDIGLRWNAPAARNLALGLLGGIGAACLVLCGPLASGAARFGVAPQAEASVRVLLFVPFLLLCGAVGEEMLFRGYGFQVLLRAWGTWAAIVPTGVLFGTVHAWNPNASHLGLINTAGFGILFGYAFVRSRDLWLPVGLHFGWNFTLPLFGVNISGITMRVTGYELEWRAGALWSGGEYGPEASILTSIMLLLLAVYVWKAPIRSNFASLVAEAQEN